MTALSAAANRGTWVRATQPGGHGGRIVSCKGRHVTVQTYTSTALDEGTLVTVERTTVVDVPDPMAPADFEGMLCGPSCQLCKQLPQKGRGGGRDMLR